jgi:hypothetical protein
MNQDTYNSTILSKNEKLGHFYELKYLLCHKAM